MSILDFYIQRNRDILLATFEHVRLTGIAVMLAVAVGIPVGISITRRQWMSQWILGIAGVIQTVPSLALLGFLLPVPLIGGIGATPAIVALFLYSLLAIIRNTYTGIREVDHATIEAARGMGMTEWQILRMVEVPLAIPMIIAGVRIATVTCIGIATLCAAIGAGGLGQFIFRGISMVNNAMILAGAIPAAVLALSMDFILGRIERKLAHPQHYGKTYET